MRPYVFINVAASLDGKISDETRKQLKISCAEDLKIVDELRANSDAIMVGIGTVLADDPRLTVKSAELRAMRVGQGKSPNPVRVIVDSKCRVPLDARVLNDEAKTIVAVSKSANREKMKMVAEVAEVAVFGGRKVDLKLLLEYLYKTGIRKVMVEGGGTLISSLISEKLVDEMRIYYAPMFIGGSSSPTICDGRSEIVGCSIERIKKIGGGFAVHVKFNP
ncbi:2,5-diamino-6-(ribosylamino)-4(3H)-pyrimidinone 5'-phosphate reductase [Archaeoglobus neptunius]|uniref:2,5-diamino-6-(ribosylamino)-4(3H)-pyrimidinone 5'-phosphate reductase n=1 Tax=Archaeoglobus neptunius TaxID=2798580 RepID=UPI00192979A8|nr:2,5-diamino-6-(ribosylamino)-4(3H)-pyrimidinone 5'-phosphate reductase [Archaeoglobus neptunius]